MENVSFSGCEKPFSVLVFIGGDPTCGHIIERKYISPDDQQWSWLKKLMGNAVLLDPKSEVPPFKCSCCGEWLIGTSTDLADYIALNFHRPGCISFYYPGGHRYNFLLCGTSEKKGCVHCVLEILELVDSSGKAHAAAIEQIGEIISGVKRK